MLVRQRGPVRREVRPDPLTRKVPDLFERTRFLEEARGARNDGQLRLAAQLGLAETEPTRRGTSLA